jgi:serine/threonine-protein kinase
MGLMAAARHYALAGDHARCGEYLQRVDRQLVGIDAGLVTMKARFAMWRADAEAVERCRKGIPRLSQVHGASASFMEGFSALYMDLFLGARDVAELDGFEPPSEGFGPRFRTLIEQLIAEVCAHLGAIDRAMAALSRAADNALVDLDWLERCPLLTPLRSHADYAALHERVRTRAEQIWTLR